MEPDNVKALYRRAKALNALSHPEQWKVKNNNTSSSSIILLFIFLKTAWHISNFFLHDKITFWVYLIKSKPT